ncbi:sensor histidine kinase [Croceimicrobium sp.]|uniref:sensor histidine kinase n=1 Tax=Croceimicrobium sp. TaxID=2828340 RepID=UPI003BA98FFE
MARAHYYLLLFLMSCLFELRAQEAAFERIGLEEGLPTLAITDMAQGPQGFIWMASEGAGLLRYDGYRFVNFGLNDFPLINQVVCSFRGERLYIQDGRRLAEFQGKDFKLISLPEGAQVLDIADFKGQLYVALSKGLYHWDGDSLMYHSELPKDFKSLGQIEDQLVLSTSDALYIWQEAWQPLDSSAYISLARGKADFYMARGLLHDLKGAPLGPANQKGDSIRFALGSSSFNAFVDQQNVYLQSRNESEGTGFYTIDYQAYFNASEIKNIYSFQSLILLSTSRGIFKMQSPFFQEFSRKLPLLNLSVDENKVFLGTPFGLEEWPYQKVISLKGLVLASLVQGDTIYIATEAGLYYKIEGQASIHSTPIDGFVFSLAKGNGEVWAAGSTGIWRFKEGEWQKLRSDEDLGFASIFSIQYHPQDGFWFASYTQGLWHFNSGNWQHFPELAGVKIDSIGISAIQPMSDKRLAVGTISNGLYIIDQKTSQAQYFGLKDLEFAEIRAFALSEEELWIGTNKGLVSLADLRESQKAGESAQIHFFGPPINGGALKENEGKLYAAGEEGLFIWDYKRFRQYHEPGVLALLEAELLREENAADLKVWPTEAFSGLREFSELDHDQNYLRFRYGLRSILLPELIQYRYRLIGQSENWTYAGTRREALFSDLKAGRYTLEVESRYPWQDWALSAKPYVFVVKEAVWRTWWFWSLIVLAVLGLAYIYLRDRWQRREERLRLENDLLEMERKALRLQMNPHFIFNALDSISSFIFKKDPKMAVRYLNNFAKLMRLTLESSMEHIHPVETEVSVLKNYLELEKLRFNNKFDYEIEVDEELDYDIGLPPMLIQPHVENAILHGLKPKEGKGFLQISFKLDEKLLCCTIEDDGIGREKAKDLPNKKAHRSMATQINKDRIDLLKRSIDEVIDLKIIDKYNQQGEACGTKVIIRLPAQEL